MKIAAWRDPDLRAAVMQAVGLGLSQRQIAQKLRVPQTRVWQAIHQRRTGELLPPPSTVRPKCQDCGCEVSDRRWARCKRCARIELGARMVARGVRRPVGRPRAPEDDDPATIEAKLAEAERWVRAQRSTLTAEDAWRHRGGAA